MAISFTIDRHDLSFPISDKYKHQIDNLYERADKKNGGYVTVALSLPRRCGTDEQNRAFHALINEFFLSGYSSFDSVFEMRNYYKLLSGGADYYIWFDDKGGRHSAELIEHIPKGALYVEVPKSWTKFTREQRANAIDLVMKEGFNAGVNTQHWDEIIQGMEK